MDDLLGLGKSTDKLIGAVERALGAVYRPYGIRRTADAEAYRLVVLERARTDVKRRDLTELARAKVDADIIAAEGEHELDERLQARLRHDALRQQQNIENIVAGAIAQPQPEMTAEEVDDDWLSEFFERAKTVCGIEMQALWSRVLSLEVGVPGTFSLRALDILRKMSRQEATAFQTACHLASNYSSENEQKRILFGAYRDSWHSRSTAPEIELAKFGLPFLERVNLAEIGLLYGDTLATGKIPHTEEFHICFTSTRLKLRAKRSGTILQSYSLTPIGTELSALVIREENDDYIAAFRISLSKLFYISDS